MDDLKQQFKKCFAPLSFFIELAKGRELSGYDVVKHLRAFDIKISHGTVYSQIHRMEQEGLNQVIYHDVGVDSDNVSNLIETLTNDDDLSVLA